MVDLRRRSVLAAMGGLTMAATDETLAWNFSFPAIEGGQIDLGAFKGHALLVVNTASFCGYTYLYDAWEKLHAVRSG